MPQFRGTECFGVQAAGLLEFERGFLRDAEPESTTDDEETAGRTKVLGRGAPVELPGQYELVRRLLERKVKFAVLRPARDQIHDRGERSDIRLGGGYARFNACAQRNGVMGGARERRVFRVDERDHERPASFAAPAAASRSGLAPDCEIAMNRTPSRSAFDAYTELIDGAAEEASTPCGSRSGISRTSPHGRSCRARR